MVKDAQVRKLMNEKSKHGQVGLAALRAGMDRKTARRYLRIGRLPSELKAPRTWRTRPDRFAADWSAVTARLEEAPELEAKALFEDLQRHRPGQYTEGQLRSFQRRVRQWRAEHGPEREIFLPQQHRPGEAMQTDFTSGSSLGVTIGEASLRAPAVPFGAAVLELGVGDGLSVGVDAGACAAECRRRCSRLGRVPEWHQTDNSTSATHDLRTGKRGFNDEYEALMASLGMRPRTIAIGEGTRTATSRPPTAP